MAGFANESDLRAALWPGIFNALFDDTGAGSVATGSAQVLQVLALAHAEVTSFLQRTYDVVPAELPSTVSFLLKLSELDFARSFAFDRRPELAERLGAKYSENMRARALKRMENLANAVQQVAPNDTPPAAKPSTSGGIVYDGAARVLIDGADGTRNSGDF